MNARIADNVGILKLKMLVMESIKKFLREYTDQVISFRATTVGTSVHPGPGHKLQAASSKLQASSTKLNKKEATSLKPQAASLKLQAASYKLHDS